MQTVLITGGTGLIGTALTKLLIDKGYKVIILSRTPEKFKAKPGVQYASWNIREQKMDAEAIQQADYVVHLAGANVGEKRWTDRRKQEILKSRTGSASLLIKAMQERSNNIKAVISASGIGYYGADPKIPNPRPFVEADAPDKEFLGETCRQWEESVQQAAALGKRVVILRQGIVLSKDGGALSEFKKPLRFGAAGIIGDGKQIMSWIHIEDLCRIYAEAIENESFTGVYNAVTLSAVSNKEFTMELAKAMKGNFYVPVHIPAFLLKLVLGEMSVEVLKSATVSAEKIRATGFSFVYPSTEAAINSCV